MSHLSIHQYPDNFSFQNTIVTVGTFDGVHLGHKSILDRLKALSKKTGGETVLATFEPHPRIALGKDPGALKLLNTAEEKAALLEAAGIDHMVVFPFTAQFSRQDEHTFIRKYLVDYLHVGFLVIGYNHRFGHRRNGNYSSLQDYGKTYGFHVEEMPRKDIGQEGVSSTTIRAMLLKGEIREANHMLGYPYSLMGAVVAGKRIGRSLGFPTANLSVAHPDKLIPARGVYAVMVELEGRMFPGMCNIGNNPTFEGKKETIEINLLNFEEDLYHKNLKVEFIERLREEVRFESREDLIRQINKDREQTMRILKDLHI